MDKLSIWDILDVDPLNFKRAWPFAWLLPELSMVLIVIDSLCHLRNTTEMFGFVHTIKKVNLSLRYCLLGFKI